LSDEAAEIAVGRRLVYSRQIEDTNIWRAELPPRGSAPATAELFISSTQPDQTPQYSPDGKKIAFASARSGSREIWVSDADRSNPVRTTSFGAPVVGCPSWSPDGRSIVFHARPAGRADVFVIPAAGGSAKRLASNSWIPSYSPDGQTMYCSSRRSGEAEIWKMPAHGGEPVQLTFTRWAEQPIASHDGKLVYFLRQDLSEIWSVPAEGGQPLRVTGPTQRYPVGFAVTSQGIYYGAPPHAGEERFIRFFEFSTGKSRPVVLAKRPFHVGMSVSLNSRYILFDQYDDSGGDLMIIEDFAPGKWGTRGSTTRKRE
jgi:Tol biopolymer transport system component